MVRPPERTPCARGSPFTMGVMARLGLISHSGGGTIVPIREEPVGEKRPRQHIHYLRTSDGVQLAWADASSGPLLIKAANWRTHLEYEWESPVWGHWLRFFSSHFRLVRYDERGCGMSDWNVGDHSQERAGGVGALLEPWAPTVGGGGPPPWKRWSPPPRREGHSPCWGSPRGRRRR